MAIWVNIIFLLKDAEQAVKLCSGVVSRMSPGLQIIEVKL